MINRTKRAFFLFIVVAILMAIYDIDTNNNLAQVVLSPTPAQITIPSAAPPATVGIVETPTPTFTPTEEGPPQLESKEEAGAVNVRAEADPESEKLGVIRFGDRYTVTGKFYMWYQIRFEPSPTRIAYVFGELVNIIGDETKIPDLTQSLLPTEDSAALNATQTSEAIVQLPGGELTLTASSRLIDAPSESIATPQVNIQSSDTNVQEVDLLPTFTYPPNVIAQAPTQISPDAVPTATPSRTILAVTTEITPITPILILGGIGVLGLLISFLFRR